jgi:hypothetical protein
MLFTKQALTWAGSALRENQEVKGAKYIPDYPT